MGELLAYRRNKTNSHHVIPNEVRNLRQDSLKFGNFPALSLRGGYFPPKQSFGQGNDKNCMELKCSLHSGWRLTADSP
jgi:hypothetical protein